MSKQENPRVWQRGAESAMASVDERVTGVQEKMGGMQSYVSEFIANDVRLLV